MKPFYKSKEVWASVLAGVIVLAKIFGVEPDSSTIKNLSDFYTMLYPALVLGLRLFFTNSAVSLPKLGK